MNHYNNIEFKAMSSKYDRFSKDNLDNVIIGYKSAKGKFRGVVLPRGHNAILRVKHPWLNDGDLTLLIRYQVIDYALKNDLNPIALQMAIRNYEKDTGTQFQEKYYHEGLFYTVVEYDYYSNIVGE